LIAKPSIQESTVNTEIETSEVAEESKLNLSVDVKETSSCQRHVTVTVPRSDIDKYYARQFDELLPKAELPGFRVGKAPRKLLEKKFRKQIGEQVKGALLMDSLSQVQDSANFSAIGEPDLDFEQVNIPEEGDLTYEFNIEVRPEFDMPEWKGLSITRPEHEFTDSEVEAEIKKFCERFSDLEPVEEPVQLDDFVTFHLTSRFEGKEVGAQDDVQIKIQPGLSLSDATIQEFDKLIVGAQVGEKRSTTAQVSEFSDNESLRGKEVEIEFEVLDVKRVSAKGAQELAKHLGLEENSIDSLVRENLVSNLQYEQRQTIRDQIRTKLTASANWDLPPDLLRRQSRREIERATMEMRSSQLPEYEITARINVMRNNILDRTEKMLKEHFILERIAEELKIDAEAEDYEKEITRIADQQRESPRRVRAMLERNGQMDALRNMIIEQKVIDMIIENANISGTKYEVPSRKQKSYAVDFFAAGSPSNIPEAKYDGGETQAIPGTESKKQSG
jgi:trigger factor